MNGDLLHLQHHCLFRECCQDGEQAFSRAKAAIRVADAVAGVIAAARPKAPALNKWTKLGPVIDWLMHAICIGYALPAVLPIAFSKDVNCAKKPKLEVEEALLTNQVNFKASHLLKYPTHQPPACPARKPVRVRLPRHSSVLSPHKKCCVSAGSAGCAGQQNLEIHWRRKQQGQYDSRGLVGLGDGTVAYFDLLLPQA